MCEDPLAYDIEPQPDTEPVWVTKDGRVLLVSEMTDDHLNNAVDFLNERIEELKVMWTQLTNEQAKRISQPNNWPIGRFINELFDRTYR